MAIAGRLRGASSRRWVAAIALVVIAVGSAVGAWCWSHNLAEDRTRKVPALAAVSDLTPSAEGILMLVPPDLREDVRMTVHRSLFVDYKSHPFLDREVLEWWRRIRIAREIHAAPHPEAISRVHADYGVTHILAPADWPGCELSGLRTLYRDATYVLVRIDAPAELATSEPGPARTRF